MAKLVYLANLMLRYFIEVIIWASLMWAYKKLFKKKTLTSYMPPKPEINIMRYFYLIGLVYIPKQSAKFTVLSVFL